ncbi:hypothetical protein BASA81_003902 [Batrachochytrium salamandrivorans]|nr:hypothetical protein BASA81_003902 [Batrachochytrium salamandrivorans]
MANHVPKEFACPITLQLLEDCVLAGDGHTYERQAILTWFSTGQTRSPVTNQVLEHQLLFPNYVLKKLILQYRAQLGLQLVEACSLGWGDCELAELLDRGADVNQRQVGSGKTPLMLLIEARRFDLALGLIANHGADASMVNDLLQTCVDMASVATANAQFIDQIRQAAESVKQQREREVLAKAKAREQQHNNYTLLSPLPTSAMEEASPSNTNPFPSLFTLQFESYSPQQALPSSPTVMQEMVEQPPPRRQYLSTGLLAMGLAVVLCLLLF